MKFGILANNTIAVCQKQWQTKLLPSEARRGGRERKVVEKMSFLILGEKSEQQLKSICPHAETERK